MAALAVVKSVAMSASRSLTGLAALLFDGLEAAATLVQFESRSDGRLEQLDASVVAPQDGAPRHIGAVLCVVHIRIRLIPTEVERVLARMRAMGAEVSLDPLSPRAGVD